MTTNLQTQSYRLIDGAFLPGEAREVLMSLIQDKISYHQRNDLSRRERLGDNDPPGGKRIDELRATREELDGFLAEAERRGMQLSIRCNIDITLQSR